LFKLLISKIFKIIIYKISASNEEQNNPIFESEIFIISLVAKKDSKIYL